MIDTLVEVYHVIVTQIAKIHHKIDIVLTLETDTDMTELLLLHKLADRDMTTIDEIHAIEINRVLTLEIDNFHNTLRHIDLLLNHDSLDLLDLDQVLKHEIKLLPFKQNNQIHLLTLKFICTILQKWLML